MNKDVVIHSPEVLACMSQAVVTSLLASSPTNPRKTFPEAAMAEMIESVKQHGILTPILVRGWPHDYPFDGEQPMFEVVAGERRFRAAKAVGLTIIPALIRQLSDAEVLEIQVIENLQRSDLHPLEEAEGYGLMIDSHGYTAEMIAEKIGKSRSYIFGRLKLLALDSESRRLFRGGLLNASIALLVARIPTMKLRTKAIDEITKKDYNNDQMSVRAAQRWIRDRYMLKLEQATFPIHDGSLPGGSCATCQKRTGNARDLFEDVDSPDVCTDPDCYQGKKLALMQRSVSKAKENGAEVIVGKEAKKLAPYGIHDHSQIDNFTQLDSKCYDDPEGRTYREIFGESVEVVLLEDHEHERLVPMVKNTILADKLTEAGIDSSAGKRDREKKQTETKVAQERAFRNRLFAEVRTEIGYFTQDGVPTLPTEISSWILMRAARQMFERLWGDSQTKISTLWQAEGKNATERNKSMLAKTVPELNAGDLWRLLVDILTIGSVGVSEHMLDTPPKALLDMAMLFDLDPDEVRKEAVSDEKDHGKVGKSAKQAVSAGKIAKNSVAETAADALDATNAAQAGDSMREEVLEPLLVGDRVRINDDLTGMTGRKRACCGREGDVVAEVAGHIHIRIAPGLKGLITNLARNEVKKLPSATSAARARDQQPGTPIPADAGIIETNEKPTEDGTDDGYGEDDGIERNEKPNPAKRQVMYRHPVSGATWSGRGRAPAWISAYLATEGNTLDMIKEAA